MKRLFLTLIYLLSTTFAYSQEEGYYSNYELNVNISNYLSETADFGTIYTGKEQLKYPLNLSNHPYFVSDKYALGDLLYDGIKYLQIPMRLDLYRGELIAQTPNRLFNIIIPADKVEYAQLHSTRIIFSESNNSKMLPEGYYLLLHNGKYPVLSQQTRILTKEVKDGRKASSFIRRTKVYIMKDNNYHIVNNKRSVLNLFKDKKRELNRYIDQKKLNFRKDIEESIVELILHYESIVQ